LENVTGREIDRQDGSVTITGEDGTAWNVLHETKMSKIAAIGVESDTATLQVAITADSDGLDTSSPSPVYAPKE